MWKLISHKIIFFISRLKGSKTFSLFPVVTNILTLRVTNNKDTNITRSESNVVELLCKGTKFLIASIQIASVDSKFDIELCWEINKWRRRRSSWKSPLTATQLYLVINKTNAYFTEWRIPVQSILVILYSMLWWIVWFIFRVLCLWIKRETIIPVTTRPIKEETRNVIINIVIPSSPNTNSPVQGDGQSTM